MASGKRKLAHLVPLSPTETIQLVEMTVRPLRLAFLVDSTASPSELLSYVAYNSQIWGGRFNFFIPVHDSSIREHWREALFQYDPDRLILCCNMTDSLKQQLSEIQPYGTKKWSDSIFEDQMRYGSDNFGSVPLHPLLDHVYRREKPIEQSNIRIPDMVSSSAFDFSIAAQFGQVTQELASVYLDAFKAEVVEFGGDDLEDYLRALEQFRGTLSPLKMTVFDLGVQQNNPRVLVLGTAVVLYSESTVAEDLSVFWNLRTAIGAVGLSAAEVMLLPFNLVQKRSAVSTLAKWVKSNIRHTNLVTLFATGVPREELSEVSRDLKEFLAEDTFVDIWYDNFRFQYFTAAEKSIHREARVRANEYAVPVSSPDWSDRIRSNSANWIVDIDLQAHKVALEPGGGYIPPIFPSLNYLLAGEPDWLARFGTDYSLRLGRGRLAARVHRNTNAVQIKLPRDETLFQEYLADNGFAAQLSEKSKYISGMTRLLGDYTQATVFQDEGIQRLFEDMAEYHHGFTLGRMKQSLRREGKESSYSNELLEELVLKFARKGIFLRGYTITCPACDLTQWYSYTQVAEQMQCAGCLSKIQPALDALFSYRLNRLFTRGIRQGAIAVLLTNLILAHTSYSSYLFIPGIEVTLDNQTSDLDIVSVIDGHVVVAEVKDLRAGLSAETMSDLEQQLERILPIVAGIDAPVFVLATLAEEIPSKLEQILDKLQARYPSVAIHHLSGTDLKRGFLIDPDKPKRRVKRHIIEWFPTTKDSDRGGREQVPGKRFIRMGGITSTHIVDGA